MVMVSNGKQLNNKKKTSKDLKENTKEAKGIN